MALSVAAVAAGEDAEAPPPTIAGGGLDDLLREGQFGDALAKAQHSDGGVPDLARSLLGVAMEGDDSYNRWYALRAAQGLRDRELGDYARRALDKGDRYDKSLALDVLLRADPAGSRAEFESALESPHRSIRVRGLRGLAALGDPGLAERFTEVLSEDPDPDLRAFAVRALGRSGSPQAPANLYRALDDEVAMVQEEAVMALAALGGPGLVPVLRRRLQDAAPEDRVRALRLAGLAREPEMVSDIAPFLADADPEVRAYAAGAILMLAAPDGPAPIAPVR